MSILDVKKYGARGDGTVDDTLSIRQAVSAVTEGSTLYFPAGTYLIQTPGTLISLQELSNVVIRFDAGAELLLDNLNSKGLGSGHAFFFRGPATGLTLDGLRIRWKTKPAKRSMGDGIRIDGPSHVAGPSDQRTFKNITIKNCHVSNAPQTGMVLMGCSDIEISDISLSSTWADGVHLNACRRFTVRRVTGIRVGDDTVALVTYDHPDPERSSLNGREGPYAQSALGDWSNDHGIVEQVRSSQKITANGIRVAGARNVTISNVYAHQRKAAIIVDAGKKDNTFGWSYQASRQIRISGVEADECHVGLHIMTFNVSPVDEVFWNFGITISNLIVQHCIHDNLLVEKCGGIRFDGIHSRRGRVRLINISDLTVNQLRHEYGNVIIHGLRVFAEQEKLSIGQDSNLTLKNIVIQQGNLQVENADQVTGGRLAVYQSTGDTGIALVNLRQASFEELTTVMPQRYGIRVIRCQQLDVKVAVVTSNSKKCIPLEVGGGNKSGRTKGITFDKIVYKNKAGKPRVLFQQGPYAPKEVSINMEWSREKNSPITKRHFQLR